jgi:hypothetical protein
MQRGKPVRKLALLSSLALAFGCARTDSRISDHVRSRISREPAIPSRAITADTHDGIVTLSGTVESPEQKEQALRAARETAGVRSVVDQIHVASAATPGEVSGNAPSSLTGAMPPGGRSPAAAPPTTAGNTNAPPPP